MIAIADSGSTKTRWTFIDKTSRRDILTSGMNPAVHNDGQIVAILANELPPLRATTIAEVHFYGAGCTPANVPRMRQMLAQAFGDKAAIAVYSDMLGAARALFGDNAGIACIIGTGSNSCLYDGKRMTDSVPSLGYILGDEGGGAALGRNFLNAIFKRRLPAALRDEYLTWAATSLDDVISRVYRGTSPNRFLASTAPFVAQHIDDCDVERLVIDNFRAFFRHNILPYGATKLPVGIVGGLAAALRRQLLHAAEEEHVDVDRILASPSDALADYHTRTITGR